MYEAESKEKHAGVDYKLSLYPLQCLLQHIYSTMGNPMPESNLWMKYFRKHWKQCKNIDWVGLWIQIL